MEGGNTMPRGYARIDLGHRKRPDWPLNARIENGDFDPQGYFGNDAIRCDYPGCVDWGQCPHSKPHEKVTAASVYPLVNVVCGTCPHDPRAICQPVKEVKNGRKVAHNL